jgi:hypothetical protein
MACFFAQELPRSVHLKGGFSLPANCVAIPSIRAAISCGSPLIMLTLQFVTCWRSYFVGANFLVAKRVISQASSQINQVHKVWVPRATRNMNYWHHGPRLIQMPH